MYSIYYNFAPETFISIISDMESKNSKRKTFVTCFW